MGRVIAFSKREADVDRWAAIQVRAVFRCKLFTQVDLDAIWYPVTAFIVAQRKMTEAAERIRLSAERPPRDEA